MTWVMDTDNDTEMDTKTTRSSRYANNLAFLKVKQLTDKTLFKLILMSYIERKQEKTLKSKARSNAALRTKISKFKMQNRKKTCNVSVSKSLQVVDNGEPNELQWRRAGQKRSEEREEEGERGEERGDKENDERPLISRRPERYTHISIEERENFCYRIQSYIRSGTLGVKKRQGERDEREREGGRGTESETERERGRGGTRIEKKREKQRERDTNFQIYIKTDR